MQTDTVDIGSVIPYARNPRRNEAAVAKVAASLKEFGWRQPIVVDEQKHPEARRVHEAPNRK